jgi:hypothetical protein
MERQSNSFPIELFKQYDTIIHEVKEALLVYGFLQMVLQVQEAFHTDTPSPVKREKISLKS